MPKPGRFYVFLISVAAVPAIMLLCFHFLLYVFHPQLTVDLQENSQQVWAYLLRDNGLTLPDLAFLDMRGRHHMLDVKRILVELRHVWWIVTVVFLALSVLQLRHKDWLPGTLRWSAYAGLGILLAGGLLAVTNFRWAFIMLHYLLFTEQTWIFAADSILIRLFPLSYFQQFFISWFVLCCAAFLMLWLLSRFLRRMAG